MGNIIDLPVKKTVQEWRDFAEKQFITIQFLQEANSVLQKEIDEIKKSLPQPGQSAVEKVIVSPERALIEDQIAMIQARSYMKELNLEDVKKLDILLKHSKILKEQDSALDGKSKPVALSPDELIKIAQVEQK